MEKLKTNEQNEIPNYIEKNVKSFVGMATQEEKSELIKGFEESLEEKDLLDFFRNLDEKTKKEAETELAINEENISGIVKKYKNILGRNGEKFSFKNILAFLIFLKILPEDAKIILDKNSSFGPNDVRILLSEKTWSQSNIPREKRAKKIGKILQLNPNFGVLDLRFLLNEKNWNETNISENDRISTIAQVLKNNPNFSGKETMISIIGQNYINKLGQNTQNLKPDEVQKYLINSNISPEDAKFFTDLIQNLTAEDIFDLVQNNFRNKKEILKKYISFDKNLTAQDVIMLDLYYIKPEKYNETFIKNKKIFNALEKQNIDKHYIFQIINVKNPNFNVNDFIGHENIFKSQDSKNKNTSAIIILSLLNNEKSSVSDIKFYFSNFNFPNFEAYGDLSIIIKSYKGEKTDLLKFNTRNLEELNKKIQEKDIEKIYGEIISTKNYLPFKSITNSDFSTFDLVVLTSEDNWKNVLNLDSFINWGKTNFKQNRVKIVEEFINIANNINGKSIKFSGLDIMTLLNNGFNPFDVNNKQKLKLLLVNLDFVDGKVYSKILNSVSDISNFSKKYNEIRKIEPKSNNEKLVDLTINLLSNWPNLLIRDGELLKNFNKLKITNPKLNLDLYINAKVKKFSDTEIINILNNGKIEPSLYLKAKQKGFTDVQILNIIDNYLEVIGKEDSYQYSTVFESLINIPNLQGFLDFLEKNKDLKIKIGKKEYPIHGNLQFLRGILYQINSLPRNVSTTWAEEIPKYNESVEGYLEVSNKVDTVFFMGANHYFGEDIINITYKTKNTLEQIYGNSNVLDFTTGSEKGNELVKSKDILGKIEKYLKENPNKNLMFYLMLHGDMQGGAETSKGTIKKEFFTKLNKLSGKYKNLKIIVNSCHSAKKFKGKKLNGDIISTSGIEATKGAYMTRLRQGINGKGDLDLDGDGKTTEQEANFYTYINYQYGIITHNGIFSIYKDKFGKPQKITTETIQKIDEERE